MPNRIRMICLGLLAVCATGCESTRWNWLKRDDNLAAKKNANPTVQGLVDYLNDNARRVQTMRVDDLDVDASLDSQSFNLRGRIFAEKPRNFRMKVTLFGKDEVDIGSNPNEFWFWAAKNPDKYQYFCSYNDLTAGKVRMMPLPIQPEWVMETMGLGPYGPANKYTLEAEGRDQVRLVEKTKSPQGYAVRKVIVMNRREMRMPEPQVTAFLLLDDATGKEICSAHVTRTTQDRRTGAILPYRMELRMPAQKMKMLLKMDSITINGAVAKTAFDRPQMTGIQPFNLATGRTEAWPLQRTGGLNR